MFSLDNICHWIRKVEIMMSYNKIIKTLEDKYLCSAVLINVKEIEDWLIFTLKQEYPKISINFTVVRVNSSICIRHHNDFEKQLKKFYPEALF